MEEPGFWDDPEKSTRMVREAKNLKDDVETYRELEQEYDDIQVMIQMGYEENDASVIPDIQEMLDHFIKTLEDMRLKLLLSGEYDTPWQMATAPSFLAISTSFLAIRGLAMEVPNRYLFSYTA